MYFIFLSRFTKPDCDYLKYTAICTSLFLLMYSIYTVGIAKTTIIVTVLNNQLATELKRNSKHCTVNSVFLS